MSFSEFDIIRDYFAPLAQKADGAFGLEDDAAALASGEYIVTKDMMIEGVHFLKSDPRDLVARKLMRVNLSDLAAKGAKPIGYFLAVAWPASVKPAHIRAFADGLAADQEIFRVALFGGDTTRHRVASGPLTLSATFFGSAPRQGVVRRNGAAPGDDLYVTGTIGDAGLGLAALEKREKISAADKGFLVERYRLPEPRLTIGGALSGLASASIDVSDGLIADAAHLASQCRASVTIEAAQMPLSPAAQRWLDAQEDKSDAYGMLASFGDDYEILFAAPPTRRRAIDMAAQVSKTTVTRIGSLAKGEGVKLIDEAGDSINLNGAGFDHFA